VFPEEENRMNNITKYIAVLGLGLGLLAAVPQTAYAQTAKAMPPVSLDLRDAPIRQALEQLFQTVKADFQIDNGVAGFVTLKITDQPFENALKLILRGSLIPLTYSVEGGVYIVKPRLAPIITETAPPPPFPEQITAPAPRWEVIHLTYIDAADLAQILGIQMLPFGARFGGQQGGAGMGGGFGTGGFGAPGTGFGGFGGGIGGPGFGSGQPGAGFGSGQMGNPGAGNRGGNPGNGGRYGLNVGNGINNLIANQAGDAILVEY
jgi:hypothetical protein